MIIELELANDKKYKEDFEKDLRNTDFSEIRNNHNDPNSAIVTLTKILHSLVQKHLPKKTKKIKSDKKQQPWVTKEIKKMILKQHVLYTRLMNNPEDQER